MYILCSYMEPLGFHGAHLQARRVAGGGSIVPSRTFSWPSVVGPLEGADVWSPSREPKNIVGIYWEYTGLLLRNLI